jgi:dTDP-4-dehydrorhamnose 3,5-epimerase-like enzyme
MIGRFSHCGRRRKESLMTERTQPLPIPGALLIEAVGAADERGGFFEYLRAGDLQAASRTRRQIDLGQL